jgi:hypothetical protein
LAIGACACVTLRSTPVVDRPGHLVDERPGGEQLGHAVGQHRRDELVVAQRLPADDPLAGERAGVLDQPVGSTEAARRHHQPLEPEPLVRERQ